LDVKIKSTCKANILGVDKRSAQNVAWCAATYGVNRLYWVNGYLLCMEVYEKSFEHEILTGEFPISQVCYAKYPKYEKFYEVERGVQIPVVDVSDMKLFQGILKAVLSEEKTSEEQKKLET
jgi:hypothetical protein